MSTDLELIGHTPWIDDLDIRPGESIASAIEKGLSKARHAIVIISEAALKSNWVNAEWKEKFWDTLKTHKIRVVPVLKEKCELPYFLRGLSYADFTKSYAVGFATPCLTPRPIRPQVAPADPWPACGPCLGRLQQAGAARFPPTLPSKALPS